MDEEDKTSHVADSDSDGGGMPPNHLINDDRLTGLDIAHQPGQEFALGEVTPGSETGSIGDDSNIDLPSNVWVTDVPLRIFDSDILKLQLEAAFQKFQSDAKFHYLRSLKRVLVMYSCSAFACQARITMHGEPVCDGAPVKVYFAQPEEKVKAEDLHLKPPKPQKQFLISPPASPPVGWSQVPEAVPAVNLQLLSALTSLQPGEIQELVAPTASKPGIVVYPADLDSDVDSEKLKPKIIQTRCPKRGQQQPTSAASDSDTNNSSNPSSPGTR